MQLATAMDSYEDAAKQLSSYSHLSRQTEDFCENPSCLGKVWHDWGCCSTGSTISTSATIASATTTEPSTETDLVDPGWGLENVVDELLRMCEQDQKPNPALAQPASGRYAKPVTNDEVTKARYESVPKKTRDDSSYCMRLWED